MRASWVFRAWVMSSRRGIYHCLTEVLVSPAQPPSPIRPFGHHGQIHYQCSKPNSPSMLPKSYSTSNTLHQQYLASKQQRARHRRSKSMVGHPWVELAQGNRPNPADPRRKRTQNPRMATASNHPGPHSHVQRQAVIPPASQALLHSPTGPFASRAFTTIPYTTEFEYPSHLFGILLLRRLRSHLPFSARFCRCRRPLDPLGDHRAACAQSGVLRARGGRLERAAARICRGRGSSSHHEYSARGSQHPHLVQSRRPSHRGYCQWVPKWGEKPASRRYHLGIAPHQVR